VKTLFVVHQFLPRHIAGSELYTYHLAKALQRRGHEVCVYTTEAYVDRETSELTQKEWDGIPVWEAVHNNTVATFEESYLDEEKEAQFRRVLDDVQPDVVHVQHLHQHSIGYLDIAHERGLPIVYTLHEYLLMCLRFGWLVRPGWVLCDGPDPSACAACAEHLPLPRAPAPAGQPPYLAAVEERQRVIAEALDKVDLFVSPSRFLRQRFVDTGLIAADRILYSDNGIPTAAFQGLRRTPSETLRFGFVGTIAEWKGVHLIVEAFDGLPEEGVDCQIWGVLEYFPDYVDRLRREAKHPGIRFCGRFENDKIGQILAGIDVLIVPSLWFENSPLTIHEAFLAGTPVVTADQGGMAEYVEPGKNGLHFRMHDAADLRKQLRRLIEEPGLRASLTEFPELKEIETDAALTEERYRALLAGRRPTG